MEIAAAGLAHQSPSVEKPLEESLAFFGFLQFDCEFRGCGAHLGPSQFSFQNTLGANGCEQFVGVFRRLVQFGLELDDVVDHPTIEADMGLVIFIGEPLNAASIVDRRADASQSGHTTPATGGSQ